MNMKNNHKRLGHGSRLTCAAAAAVVLAVAPGVAQADTTIADIGGTQISIFGIIDAGFLYQSKTDPDGDAKTSMETSGLRQSVLGFKGNRDLNNGMNAFFNLEMHFDTDNGEFHGTGDASGSGRILWRRQANVGLSGDWGSVTIGRQYGPALIAHIGTEPRAFKEQFSNLYAWAYNQLAATFGPVGTERNTNNDVGIFFSNAVQYRNTLGPVSFGVLWAMGEQPDTNTDNSVWAVGAAYNGPVTVSASYQVIKDQGTGNDNVKHAGLGFAVPFGDLTFKANYLNAKNETRDGGEVSNVDAIGVGIDYRWNEHNTATVAFYRNKDDENDDDETNNLVISNDYAVRPDTTIYTQMAYVDAGDAATIKTSIVAAGVPAVGEKTLLLNVGINFAF